MFQITKICRLRIKTDGEGIRTLVVTHGCPLRCRYCINPQTWNGERKEKDMSAAELYERTSQDRFYFMASGGGITFGGGEPLKYAEDIAEFRKLSGNRFTLFAETSLQVPEAEVRTAAGCIDRFYVDIKTLDVEKYREYTGGDTAVLLRNLRILTEEAGSSRIVARVPLIPGVTTPEDQERYCEELAGMGIRSFDRLTYIVS